MTEPSKSPQPGELWSLSVKDFVAATAGKTPIPGGGSVAGVVGGLATALAEMCVVFTRGKKQFAEHEAELASLAGQLERARAMYEALTSDDASAYTLYQEANRCTDETKAQQQAVALAAAIDVPRQMTALTMRLMDDLAAISTKCNQYLLSDLAAAAALAEAVVKLCDYNVRTNARFMPDAAAAGELKQASARDCARAAALRQQVEDVVGKLM